MRRLTLLLMLMAASFFTANAYVPGTNCAAIYHVPNGEAYNTRLVRPPFWTTNRWECLTQSVGYTDFENSPANGTDAQYQLALIFTSGSTNVYYHVLYIDPEYLHIYTFGVGQTEIPPEDYSINQGTGVVTLETAPAEGAFVFFEIVAPT